MATIEPYLLTDGKTKRYRVRYRTPENRSTDKSGFTTKRDAQDFPATVEVAKMRGEFIAPSAGRITVGPLVEKWIMGRESDLAPSTFDRYQGIVRTHVVPKWGTVPLGSVMHSDIQAWIGELSRAGQESASIRKIYRVLKQTLDMAVGDRLLSANPAVGVKIAVPKIAPRRYLTHQQVRAFADACGDREAVVLVLAYCGLRWGEMAALHVRNVNLMTKRINVEVAVAEVNGKLVWGDPKPKQRRWVPIPSFVVESLVSTLAGKGPDDLAFSGERAGGVLRVRIARRSWFDKAVIESGCPDGFHPHELRHTAASLAIQSGANVKVVQRMLGHESAAMTLWTLTPICSPTTSMIWRTNWMLRADQPSLRSTLRHALRQPVRRFVGFLWDFQRQRPCP
jgi:integrase